MRRLLPLLCLCALALRSPQDVAGAAYAPAATASVDWTPNTTGGVGVPGGIPARATIYTTLTATGDTTDRQQAIYEAMENCPSGQTVLLGPGDFYVSSLTFGQGSGWTGAYYANGNAANRTLRGSGTSTRIILTSGAVTIRGTVFYETTYGGTVTAGATKGSTSITVTNPADLVIGKQMALIYENDDTLPTFSVGGTPSLERQLVMVLTVNTGTGVVTFQPPLYQSNTKYVGGASRGTVTWSRPASVNEQTISGFGLEDLVIDNTTAARDKPLRFYGAHGSWLKGVRMEGVLNYGIELLELVQCEIRQCYVTASIDPNWVAASHAGITITDCSALLVEDNIVVKNFPLIEVQGGAVQGSVFAYNFLYQGAQVTAWNASHSAGNRNNLYEGNSITGLTWDGYFGGATREVVYRNYIHGHFLGSSNLAYPVTVARYNRAFEFAGNMIGASGHSVGISWGNRSAFGASNLGTANSLTGDPQADMGINGTLTNLSSTTCSVVVNSLGQLDYSGNPDGNYPTSVRWTGGARTDMTITGINVGTMTISLSGGGGSAIPSTGTAVNLFFGANNYRELDEAVEYSSLKIGNNYAMHGDTIPAGEALGTTTLPDSLFRGAAPDWWGGLPWPPWDPVSPNRTLTSGIPAAVRYFSASSGNTTPPAFRIGRASGVLRRR